MIEDGIIWPFQIAPFEVVICPIGGDTDVLKVSEDLYDELISEGVEVILDDRPVRPGVMFKDADLVGFPLRVTIGKRSLSEGGVEFKLRKEKERTIVKLDEAKERIRQILAPAR